MQVDIYVREKSGSREIRFPWLPDKIDIDSGGTVMASYDILDKGPVQTPTGSGLISYSWEGVFPGQSRGTTAMQRGTWKAPKQYHTILEDWRTKGTILCITVTGYPINKDVLLEEYTASATGGFGDMEYSLKFTEYRSMTISSTQDTSSSDSSKRTETQSSTTSYTIKTGDTLWGISQKFLNAGKDWQKIYDANKEIIESTAKKYGKSSSNNGWWIYPGVTIKIPQ